MQRVLMDKQRQSSGSPTVDLLLFSHLERGRSAGRRHGITHAPTATLAGGVAGTATVLLQTAGIRTLGDGRFQRRGPTYFLGTIGGAGGSRSCFDD